MKRFGKIIVELIVCSAIGLIIALIFLGSISFAAWENALSLPVGFFVLRAAGVSGFLVGILRVAVMSKHDNI